MLFTYYSSKARACLKWEDIKCDDKSTIRLKQTKYRHRLFIIMSDSRFNLIYTKGTCFKLMLPIAGSMGL